MNLRQCPERREYDCDICGKAGAKWRLVFLGMTCTLGCALCAECEGKMLPITVRSEVQKEETGASECRA